MYCKFIQSQPCYAYILYGNDELSLKLGVNPKPKWELKEMPWVDDRLKKLGVIVEIIQVVDNVP